MVSAWPLNVLKWKWFWAEGALKAWRTWQHCLLTIVESLKTGSLTGLRGCFHDSASYLGTFCNSAGGLFVLKILISSLQFLKCLFHRVIAFAVS
jgi:hypothetical protein